jgi:hypothetical protein
MTVFVALSKIAAEPYSSFRDGATLDPSLLN